MTQTRPAAGVVPAVPGFPPLGRTRVMGVLNVTPDSFSDGGRFFSLDAALAQGMDLITAGADLVDVGGESTRPGAGRVAEDEERRRVLPVVAALAAAGVPVSIDTTRGSVAAAALDAGAILVNDVSAGSDPGLLRVVAERGVALVLMHGRGPSADMASRAVYRDVVGEVVAELAQRLDAALDAGVDGSALLVDPGLGFAKTAEHNWTVLANLDRLAELGSPVVVGASRKRFLGALLAGPDGTPRPPEGREDATTALSALAALAGAWAVRVHEAGPSADAVRVAAAVRAATGPPPSSDAGSESAPDTPAPGPEGLPG